MARRKIRRRRAYAARPVRRRVRRVRARPQAYYFRAKRRRRSGGRKMSFLGGSKMKPMIDGALAGAIGQVATSVVGDYGHPVSALAVGFIRNNPVLLTEGSRGLGAMLVSNFVGGGSGGFASQI